MITTASLIAGLLIFAIGFALGFFVCILGFIAEKNRIAAEKEDSKETSRNNTTVKGGKKTMLEVNYEDALTTPKWKDDDSLEVEFSFRNGNKTTVKIDTAGKSQLSIDDMKNQLLRKLKLLRNMCEHGTHGYIEVQGFIARADDLIAMKIR